MVEMRLEVCVDDLPGLHAAVAGGADRIELCSSLALGGLTPSWGLMKAAARSGIPIQAMIRPRAGGFVYSTAEIELMLQDIDAARACGLQGVVLGALDHEGRLHQTHLRQLLAASAGLQVTLHRAFDLLVEPVADCVARAVDHGFHRILTSGRAVQAAQGTEVLRHAIAAAGQHIIIMPGAGLHAGMIADFLKEVPAREVHASCSSPSPATSRALAAAIENPPPRRTNEALVRQMKTVLSGIADVQK